MPGQVRDPGTVTGTEASMGRAKPVAYQLWATFNQFWAALRYSGLLFWATWLSR